MKPDAPDGIRGEFKPIATGQPGLTVTEHLPRFAKVLDQFAQVRSVHHRMKNHNSATYYSLTGHAPPLDDIRLRDTQELYPAYGSTVARFRPVRRPGDPVVRLVPARPPRRQRDARASTPASSARRTTRSSSARTRTSPSFRLPELSLPDSLPLDRLDDRRGLHADDRLAGRPARLVRAPPRGSTRSTTGR